jgi:hypothetical protein
MSQIKVIVFKEDYKCIIAGIKEIGADIGEPDCELENPYEFVIQDDDFDGEYKDRLTPWKVLNISSDKKCRIQSDTILTLVDPESFILEAYTELTSE